MVVMYNMNPKILRITTEGRYIALLSDYGD